MPMLQSFSFGMATFACSFLVVAVIGLLGVVLDAFAAFSLLGAVLEGTRIMGLVLAIFCFTRYAPCYVHSHFWLYAAGVSLPALSLVGLLLVFPRIATDMSIPSVPGWIHLLPFLTAVLLGLALGRVKAKAAR